MRAARGLVGAGVAALLWSVATGTAHAERDGMFVHQGQAAVNDYCYALTEQGMARARAAMQAC